MYCKMPVPFQIFPIMYIIVNNLTLIMVIDHDCMFYFRMGLQAKCCQMSKNLEALTLIFYYKMQVLCIASYEASVWKIMCIMQYDIKIMIIIILLYYIGTSS